MWEKLLQFLKKIEKNLKILLTRSIISDIMLLALRENPFNIVGVYNIEVPPVPIPNTVVKLNRAENTWWVAAREDRSSPTQ